MRGIAYPVIVVRRPEGGYTALFPELPGAATVRETLEEVLQQALVVQELRLGVAREYGDLILPPPGEKKAWRTRPWARCAWT